MKAQAGWEAQACRASAGGFEKFVEDTSWKLSVKPYLMRR